MRKYQISGVEHVHMMRRVPRSYDMTRTHIMHQSVNRHVDVVLRCSPKHWKKKKVPVTLVRGERDNEAVRIRVHADRRYVAVRRVSNEKYEADRRRAASAYETRYGQPSAGNRALIHDMKSQLATMAQRSADYIDGQLRAGDPAMNIPARRNVPPAAQEAPVPAFPQVPETSSQPILSPEVDDILRKGGYKRPSSASANPYASDYLRQASDAEFHSLMDSLERSLDAAYDKYAVQTSAPAQENAPQDDGDWGLHNLPSSDEPGRNGSGADARQPEEDFAPALSFRDGGEHYLPQDDLFGKRFDSRPSDGFGFSDGEEPNDYGYFGDPDESYDDSGFAGETQEDDGARFDVSRFFADEEFDAPPPDSVPSADFDKQESILSPRFAAQPQQQTELPQGYPAYPQEEAPRHLYPDEEEDDTFAPPPQYPAQDDDFALPPSFPQEEESFPAAAAPTDGGVSYVLQTGEEDEKPLMLFPDEDEEDEGPLIMFPDEDEEDSLPPAYPQDEGGYSPPPVSPDRNEYWTGDARQTQTLLSRTGGQLRKAIGVIRSGGRRDDDKDGHTPPYAGSGNIEITFSDRNG